MWDIDNRFDASVLDALPASGFEVSSTGGVVRAEKYGCGAEFRRMPDGRFQMTVPPSIVRQGQFTRLWDAGYQKFLIVGGDRKIPAHADDLRQMRRFNEELRTAIGVPTHYNEALGSTCQVTVYDRVQGRPGDVPDKSVGVKPEPEEH